MSKILLVEDNEMNRDMLTRRLERKGYEVVIAVDGQAGINMASSASPDIILMDLSLPVIDGWEATRKIKVDPATQSIPIIALTAHAMAGDEQKALEAGCDDYDTKPVDLSRLLDKIENLLAIPLAGPGLGNSWCALISVMTGICCTTMIVLSDYSVITNPALHDRFHWQITKGTVFFQ